MGSFFRVARIPYALSAEPAPMSGIYFIPELRFALFRDGISYLSVVGTSLGYGLSLF